MNTFSKKSLHVALAGLGVLGLANTADAVMVNPNGLGQVLIYPYYTVRGAVGNQAAPYNTLLTIVNTTASTKAVKVRFREGMASAEVLDFNLFMSPHDVWTAAVTPGPSATPYSTDNPIATAEIVTNDTSCTIPSFTPGVAVPFRSIAADADPIGAVTGRVTEGYFEVFEMATYADTDPVAVGAKHSSGTPANCAAITNTSAAAAPLPATGGLAGSAMLINVQAGDEFAETATAMTQFWDPTAIAGSYSTTGDTTPDFSNALPVGTAVNSLGQIVTAQFATGELASTAALQKQAVINEFVLDSATLSGTDWVVTFPTKHLLVSPTAAIPPFSSPLTAAGSCDPATLTTYDREERTVTPSGPDFSPSPTPTGFAMCWESNVLSFAGGNILGSANRYDVATGFTNGWAELTFGAGAVNISGPTAGFDPASATTFTPSTTFSGLPVVGFGAQTFVNGTLTDPTTGETVRSIYGAAFGHRYIGPQ